MKTKHLLKVLALFVIFAIVSCKNDVEKDKKLTSGILTENMDTLVNPGNNFTRYVNGTWIKNTHIPADKSSYGIGYILHEESEDNIKKIIEGSSSGEFPKGSDEQKVGDLYQSYMDMEKRNELGISPLEDEFLKIEKVKNYDELAAYFAYANKYGYSMPLKMLVYQDLKNPSIYTVYTMQSGLGLPDREYYLKKDDRSKEIRTKYVAFIELQTGDIIVRATIPAALNRNSKGNICIPGTPS